MIIACPACKTRFNVDGSKLAATGTRVRCAQCGHLWLQTPEGPLAAPKVEAKPVPASPTPSEAEAPPRAQAQRLVEPKPVPKPAPAPPPRVPVTEPEVAMDMGRGPPPPPAPTPPRGAPPGFKAGRKPEGDRFSSEDEQALATSRAPVLRSEEPTPVRARSQAASAVQPARVLPVPSSVEPVAEPRRRFRILPFVILFILLGLAVGAAFVFRQNIVRFWPRTAVLFEAVGAPVDVVGITFRNVIYTRPFSDGVPAIEVHGELVNELKNAVVIPRLRAALLDGGGRELYSWTFSADAARLEPRQVTSFASRLSSPPANARDLEIRFVRGNE